MIKRICQNCGKGRIAAARQKHRRGVASKKFSKRAQAHKRVLQPNLHWATILVAGARKRMLLCAKCIKKLKKEAILKQTKVDKATGV